MRPPVRTRFAPANPDGGRLRRGLHGFDDAVMDVHRTGGNHPAVGVHGQHLSGEHDVGHLDSPHTTAGRCLDGVLGHEGSDQRSVGVDTVTHGDRLVGASGVVGDRDAIVPGEFGS